MLRAFDDILNGITMYRLMLYSLLLIAAAGIGFSALGALSLPLSGLALSFGVLMVVGYVTNWLLATVFNATTNFESSLITTLILFCIMPPATSVRQAVLVALTVVLALASKYVLAIHRRHIFNPAATGAAIMGITGLLPATWWVGSRALLPVTVLVGVTIARKLRRFQLVACFMAAALVVMEGVGLAHGRAAGEIAVTAFTSWPLVFLGTIMLTEPLTSPSHHRYMPVYGVVVGGLFASQLQAGPFSTTPELSLVVGNLFAYAVSWKRQLRLRLVAKRRVAAQIYDFTFSHDGRSDFVAGQYLELTVPFRRLDSRGNRRTFTIASSPTEPELHLGIKFYEPPSVFKQTLQELKPGETISATHIAGDFVLPADTSQKLIFIAGGIGITPFRSMAKYLVDSKQHRDITLLYLAADSAYCYDDVFLGAANNGVTLTKLVDPKECDERLRQIAASGPRRYYISGPPRMVRHFRATLRKLGVSSRHVVTDYFTGY